MIANEMVVPEICLEQFTGGRDMEAPRAVMRGAWWGCPVGRTYTIVLENFNKNS